MKRFETLYRMKCELKAYASVIKQRKADGCQSSSMRESFEYRHLHIARCLLKGRTIEEIEGNPDTAHKKSGNKPNMKYLERLLEKWKPQHDAEQAAWEAAEKPALATA